MEKDSYYYYQIGIQYLERGEIEQAIINLEKSISLKNHFKTYQILHECYMKVGKDEQSYHYIYLAYCENPRNDKVAFLYAKALFQKKDIVASKKIVNEILERNTSYLPAVRLLEEIECR